MNKGEKENYCWQCQWVLHLIYRLQVSKVVWNMHCLQHGETKYCKPLINERHKLGKHGRKYMPYSNVDKFLKVSICFMCSLIKEVKWINVLIYDRKFAIQASVSSLPQPSKACLHHGFIKPIDCIFLIKAISQNKTHAKIKPQSFYIGFPTWCNFLNATPW